MTEEKKMAATIIYLDPEIRVRLKHLAADEGVSVTELVRRAIAEYLKRPKPPVKRPPVVRQPIEHIAEEASGPKRPVTRKAVRR